MRPHVFLVLALAAAAACSGASAPAVRNPKLAEVGLEQYGLAQSGKCVVVLVHGFNVQDETQFEPLAEELNQRGANVFEFKYDASFVGADNNNTVVDRFVEAVKRLKETYGLTEIKILGHSLGGLVTWRSLIEDREDGRPTVAGLGFEKIRYVTIATAWGGFDLAKYNKLDITEPAPIGSMLAPNSPWLTIPGVLPDNVCFTPIQTVETDQKQFGDENDDVVDLAEQRNDAITSQATDGVRRVVRGHTGSFRATGPTESDPRTVPPETLALVLHTFGMQEMGPDALTRAKLMGLGFDLCTAPGATGPPQGPCAILVRDRPSADPEEEAKRERQRTQLRNSLKCRGYTVLTYVDDYDDDGDGLPDLIWDEENEERHAGADLARGVKGLLQLTHKSEALLFLEGRGQLLGRWATSSHPDVPSADTLAQDGGPPIRTVDFGETTPEAMDFEGTTGGNVLREHLDRDNFENGLDQGDFGKIQPYVRLEWPLKVDGKVVVAAFQDVKLWRLGGVQALGPNGHSAYDHAELVPGESLTLDGRYATSDCPGPVLGRTYGLVPDRKAAVREIGMNLTGDPDAFASALDRPVDTEPTVHSAVSVPEGQQALNHTHTIDHGAQRQALTQGQVDAAFNNSFYPCGAGPNGLTLCASAGPVPAGDALVLFNVLEDRVVLADPEWSYQYAFVFDADGIAGNNYQPIPQFANDFFGGTDRWYEARYTPQAGWSMHVSDGTGSPVASGARILIVGNVIALVVPAGEFALAAPPYRVTSFRHRGDYGLNPPYAWNGDVEPPVADGLNPFD